MSRFFAISAVALCVAQAPNALAAETPPAYHVTKTVTLGSPERWDYLVFDPSTHDVYVSHGDRVSVVDGRTGAIVGTVDGLPGGPHGFGISAAAGKGYTPDREAKVAAAFDLKTLKVVKRIPVDEDADAVAFDPASGHVFVIDGDPSRITVIDPRTDSALATIDVGIGKLEYAVAGGNGKLYVNGAEKKEIVRVDTKTNAVDAGGTTFMVSEPTDKTAPDYATNKKAYDDFKAQADKEPLAIKLADSVGHVRVATNASHSASSVVLLMTGRK